MDITRKASRGRSRIPAVVSFLFLLFFYLANLFGFRRITSFSRSHGNGSGLSSNLLCRPSASLLLIITGLLLFFSVPSQAQTTTILHSFNDGSVANDGIVPAGALILGSDGNFYGISLNGGLGSGNIFKMSSAGVTTSLYSFQSSGSSDGVNPVGLVQGADGNLYGLTSEGGTAGTASPGVGDGIVFKMTLSGTETVLHNFGDGTVTNDGITPAGDLIQGSDGNFYGMTVSGGSAGKGTVFKISSTGSETVLHNFGDGSVANDGVNPSDGLVQGVDGNFYGCASYQLMGPRAG
jgi:uncharacterized repeat protein (TIGR03803 family)